MEPNYKNSEIPARRSGPQPVGAVGNVLERLRNLPRPAQLVFGVVVFGIFYVLFASDGQRAGTVTATNSTTVEALQGSAISPTQVFAGLETDRPALLQNWLEQNRREMSVLKEQLEKQNQERDKALTDAFQQNAQVQQEMRQLMSDFTSEIRNIQETAQRDRETMGQLAEEQKKMQLNAPVDGVTGAGPVERRQERINQTPLGSTGGAAAPGSQALLAPLAGALNNQPGQVPITAQQLAQATASGVASLTPPPFVPPLGFIKATMLNGVDALVGGTPSPALVRLQGQYKTAMNTTVKLDGCYALVEFQGEVSTERAVGKPARMTCVYPDQGAVTYSLSGYVVDAEDGIIGVPGVFYEGDASRIAAAMLADFAAGISGAIQENNNTFSLDQNGNAVRTVSGDQARNEVAGGVNKATQSLRDYLLERVNRVLPFIRLDATRELHLVLLSGVELRSQGSAWSLLFDAEAADNALKNVSPPPTTNTNDSAVLPPPVTANGG